MNSELHKCFLNKYVGLSQNYLSLHSTRFSKGKLNSLFKGRVKKSGLGAHFFFGGGSGKIFAGSQFYCDFW